MEQDQSKTETLAAVRSSDGLGGGCEHILMTPQICPCDKTSDIPCPVCDMGLAVCCVCGAAEIELDKSCVPVDVAKMMCLLQETMAALNGLCRHFQEYGKDAGPYRELRDKIALAMGEPPNEKLRHGGENQ